MEKRILHIDMDAFFAAVEILDNHNLKNKPVVVGKDSGRGIVTTCSYEARKFGVKSAMPIHVAKSLCKDLIVVMPRHERYKDISSNIFDVLYKFTDKIQQVSIDECYMDISDLDVSATKLALQIKREVKAQFGLTLSVGISFNKFFAKIASDINKPNGIMEIKKENYRTVLCNLDISKVHGLGEKSLATLRNIGVDKIAQMYDLSLDFYLKNFGKAGGEIYNRIRGIDNREIINFSDRKSYGKETTFQFDIVDKNYLYSVLKEFALNINEYLNKHSLSAKTITIKVKTNDFCVCTKSKKNPNCIKNKNDIYTMSIDLFNTLSIAKPVRLLGITVSNFDDTNNGQLSLFN